MDSRPALPDVQEQDIALRESEERFRSTFENAAVGIAHVAPDGSWLRVNQRVCEILGYTPEELLQITFQDITHPDDLEVDLDLLQETLDGKRDTFQLDKRYFRKDGSTVWVHLTVGCVRNGAGEVDYFISVLQDITEQKRMHRALAASEARFRAAQQTTPDGFMMFSSVRSEDGRIVDFLCEYANPAAARQARMTPEELAGKQMLKTAPVNLTAGLFDVYCAVVETGQTVQDEIEVPVRGGGTCWFRYSAVKMNDGFAVSFTDITDRKRAELCLQHSEARFRAVQQTTPDGFMMFGALRDSEGRIEDFVCEYGNPASARLLLMDPADVPGHHMLKVKPSNKDIGLFDIYCDLVENGRTVQSELKYPLSNGETGWFRYSAVKIDDGFAVSFSDITDRKQAELSLRESEARFRAVQQTSPDGFIIFRSVRDRDGRITDFVIDYINPAAELTIDDKAVNVVGMTMRSRMPSHIHIGMFDRYVQVVETGEPWQGETIYPRAFGDQWYRATAAKVGDGFAVSFADITDAKKAEGLLRESDERLRSILNNIVAFVGLLSPEGILLEVNEPSLISGGVERSDVVGKPFWETYWWSHDADLREQLRRWALQAAKGGRVREDVNIRTAGDNRMTIDFQLAPIFDEAGAVTHVVTSGYDISDRKKAEQHREMLVRELSHRVKNSLATVQTIASHTLRDAQDLEAFREAFTGRLMAISKCHDLLVDATRRDADISQLVRDQVLPYARSATSQVRMSGPPLLLGAEASHTFGLVLHELATNAAKYGALSTEDGHLDISWKRATDRGRLEAIVEWKESGGPPVSPPRRRGFGSVLIEQSLVYSLGGEARIEYRPDGLWARFRFRKKDRP